MDFDSPVDEGVVVFEQEGILLSVKDISDETNLCIGKIQILEKGHGVFVVWIPDSPRESSFDPNPCYGIAYKPQQDGVEITTPFHRPIKFDVEDLKSCKTSAIEEQENRRQRRVHAGPDTTRTCNVTFVLRDGTTYPALIFPGSSSSTFLSALENYLVLKRALRNDSMILCQPKKRPTHGYDSHSSYERALAELNMLPGQSHSLTLGQLGHGADKVWRFVTDLRRDPYSATMTAFSKLSDYLLEGGVPEASNTNSELAELLRRSLSTSAELTPSHDDETTPMFDEDSHEEGYEVIPAPFPELAPRPTVTRDLPLTADEWRSYMDEEERITQVDKLKERIFRGGIEPSLRSEVWKYLLGYYNWSSTHAERMEERQRKVDYYFRMKLQWKSITEDQETRFAAFKARKDLIEKDVNRTDRTISFFAGEENPHLRILSDILMTYLMYNFDLGYVQGMSDLLAPILFVMKNEEDAFWCFVGFMDRTCRNFDIDQNGMKVQLSFLRTLLRNVDPALHNYLESCESGNMFFCFRWILVWFKREFNYPNILKLWEVLWTDAPFVDHGDTEERKPTRNFHLLVALSILDSQRTTILENHFEFTEILKHVNDLAMYIDLEETLCNAEAIFRQLANSPNVETEALRILGLPVPTVKSAETTFIAERTGAVASSSPKPIDQKISLSESNKSGSLGESSSLEVVSPLDDHKFENALNSNYL